MDVDVRVMQESFQCAANCCSTSATSVHAHESCLQSCQRSVVAAENVVQSELQSIQNKLEVRMQTRT